MSRRFSGRHAAAETGCPSCGAPVRHPPHARWSQEGGVTRCAHRGRVFHACETDSPAVDADRLRDQLRSLPKAQPGRGGGISYKHIEEGP